MISDILKNSKDQRKIIGIWLYGEEDGFLSGYVKHFTEELVFLQHYTSYGKPDGVIIENIENIESIDFDDDYSKDMEYIIAHSDEIDVEPELDFTNTISGNWQFEILDKQLGKKNRIVRIQVDGTNIYSGLVKWIDEESLILNIIGTEGQDEGKTFFKLEDITAIRINDIESRKNLLLYNWKHKTIKPVN